MSVDSSLYLTWLGPRVGIEQIVFVETDTGAGEELPEGFTLGSYQLVSVWLTSVTGESVRRFINANDGGVGVRFREQSATHAGAAEGVEDNRTSSVLAQPLLYLFKGGMAVCRGRFPPGLEAVAPHQAG